MTYDWEQEALDGIIPHIIDLNEMLGGKFQIFGISVANEDAGEGCYVQIHEDNGSMFCADVSKDVLGDAENAYDTGIENLRRRYSSQGGQ